MLYILTSYVRLQLQFKRFSERLTFKKGLNLIFIVGFLYFIFCKKKYEPSLCYTLS